MFDLKIPNRTLPPSDIILRKSQEGPVVITQFFTSSGTRVEIFKSVRRLIRAPTLMASSSVEGLQRQLYTEIERIMPKICEIDLPDIAGGAALVLKPEDCPGLTRNLSWPHNAILHIRFTQTPRPTKYYCDWLISRSLHPLIQVSPI